MEAGSSPAATGIATAREDRNMAVRDGTRQSGLSRLGLAVAAGTLGTLASLPAQGQQLAESRQQAVSCSDFPIQVGFATTTGDDPHRCVRWKRCRTVMCLQYLEMFHRFERFAGGFANLRYLRAGPDAFIGDRPLPAHIRDWSKNVRKAGRNWTPVAPLQVAGRIYDIARFELPGGRRCIAYMFRGAWLRDVRGYRSIRSGYLCGTGTALDPARVAALLADVRYSK
jgi:hypothetical protein